LVRSFAESEPSRTVLGIRASTVQLHHTIMIITIESIHNLFVIWRDGVKIDTCASKDEVLQTVSRLLPPSPPSATRVTSLFPPSGKPK